MNEENITAPVLEETTYDPEKSRKQSNLSGMTAPVLDDMDYSAQTVKKSGPQGVAAPVLDDMDAYVPQSSKKDGPQGVTAPVLDDVDDYSVSRKSATAENSSEAFNDDVNLIMNFTPEQQAAFDALSPEQKQKVIDMRKQQLAKQQKTVAQVAPEIKAPVLDEDNYTPPSPTEKKVEVPPEPVAAPVLDEAPAPAKYVPKFVDEDLEKAKKEAAKKSVSAQLSTYQKDEKESLRMMKELRQQREEEAAKKGFVITIIIAIIGVAASVLFTLFASGDYFGLGYKPEAANKFREIVANSSMYISVAASISALLLITGIKGFKSLASFIYFVFSGLMLFPGIVMITQKDGNMALNGILYGLALAGAVSVFVVLCASESVGLFFKKK